MKKEIEKLYLEVMDDIDYNTVQPPFLRLSTGTISYLVWIANELEKILGINNKTK